MNYLFSIAIIVVGIIGIVLAIKLLKGLVKTAITALLLGLVVFGATFVALYQDYTTIHSGLQNDAVLFITYENESVAAVNVTQGQTREAETINASRVNASLELYVSYEALEDETFQYKDRMIAEDAVRDVFEASSFEAIGDALGLRGSERIQLREQYDSPDAFKEQLAIMAATSALQENPNRFLLSGVQDGTIMVEPELLTTRFINYVPESLVSRAFNVTGS